MRWVLSERRRAGWAAAPLRAGVSPSELGALHVAALICYFTLRMRKTSTSTPDA